MRLGALKLVILGGLLAGCAGGEIKPAEVLDQTTGMTVSALQNPIELVENLQSAVLGNGKRTSFAYLGPVEWDRSGDITYGLWIHVAPGNDLPVGSIHESGAVTLVLDDGRVGISVIDAPVTGQSPYKSVASWGQTAYFNLDVALLKRMASSVRLDLEFRGTDGGAVRFSPTHETRQTLQEFLTSRGLTGD